MVIEKLQKLSKTQKNLKSVQNDLFNHGQFHTINSKQLEKFKVYKKRFKNISINIFKTII